MFVTLQVQSPPTSELTQERHSPRDASFVISFSDETLPAPFNNEESFNVSIPPITESEKNTYPVLSEPTQQYSEHLQNKQSQPLQELKQNSSVKHVRIQQHRSEYKYTGDENGSK